MSALISKVFYHQPEFSYSTTIESQTDVLKDVNLSNLMDPVLSYVKSLKFFTFNIKNIALFKLKYFLKWPKF